MYIIINVFSYLNTHEVTIDKFCFFSSIILIDFVFMDRLYSDCGKPRTVLRTEIQNPRQSWVSSFESGVGRDRTADTRIFSPLLYRLSYRTILFVISRIEIYD